MCSSDLDDATATLAAHTGTTILHLAYEEWVGDLDKASFQQVASDVLARLRVIAAAG